MRSDPADGLLCRDVGNGAKRCLEGQHGGGVAGLVVAHRLEESHILEAAFRPLAVLLQHGEHGVTRRSDFRDAGADHMPGQNGGRGLAECTGFHLMRKSRNGVTVQFQVNANA